MEQSELQELRCYCSRKPLLAKYGVDEDGQPFIHFKVYKQSRLYGEAVFKSGTVSLRCRECLRWHSVKILNKSKAKLEQVQSPLSE